MDQLKLENLVIETDHNGHKETFTVSSILSMDLHRASRNDDIHASVDCAVIAKLLKDKLQEKSFKLLEAAAEYLAHSILSFAPYVKTVDLTLTKEVDPSKFGFHTLQAHLTRSWHTAYIGLGSNLGDRQAYMDQGVQALQDTPDCIVDRCSSWMEAIPYGYTQQDNFLNGVVQIRTLLTPYELMDRIHEIEKATNLEWRIHWGPRTLDLDILFYDDLVIQEEDLCIPHVDMKNRVFVLVPMAEIAPYYHHPVYGITIHEMLQKLNDNKLQ